MSDKATNYINHVAIKKKEFLHVVSDEQPQHAI